MEDTGIQPGQTVTPTKSKPDNKTNQSPEPPAEVPEPAKPASPEAAHQDEQFFKPAASQPKAPEETDGSRVQAVTWTASEFIAHAKSFGWYAGLALAAAALSIVVFIITRDPVSVGVVVVGAVLLGVYGRHQPRQLEYHLDNRGLSIGQKHFGYGQFRSFSVIPEDAFDSIVFMPLKRFALPTTIYFAPEDEDKIVGLLGGFLPFEERGHDAVDRLMQRIRF